MKEITQIKKQILDIINVAQISQKDQEITTGDLKNLMSMYKILLECLSRIQSMETNYRLKSITDKHIDHIILLLEENKYDAELFDVIKQFVVISGLSESDRAFLGKLINLDSKENKSGKIVASLKCDSMDFDND